jgi:ketosteroid isomerase-like protein
MEFLTEIFAEDTVWHWGGNSQISGDYKGRDAVFGVFATLGELVDGMEFIDHDFVGNDKHTVALGMTRGSRDGKSLEVPHVEVYHWKDGQIIEEWYIVDDQAATDAFWA